MLVLRIFALAALLSLQFACSRNQEMKTLYAERCLACHGTSGRGDGPIASSLPVPVPDFRLTVERKSVRAIRKVIVDGKGIMPAYGPALSRLEVQDMIRAVRVVSEEGRPVEWWEKIGPLLYAHCSLPWQFGDDEEEPQRGAGP